MLKDIDIRAALIEKICKENEGHSHRIINEMAVCDGEARVDIAVANGKLCGYEIKSDKDTLERLPKQMDAYNKTFDRVTIVVGRKYEDKILEEIPHWWGIKVAYLNKFGKVSFKSIRGSKTNKSVDAYSLIELLWKDEIFNLLKQNNIKGITNKNRRKLRDIAVHTIPLNQIKDYTREMLKFREGWRVDQ